MWWILAGFGQPARGGPPLWRLENKIVILLSKELASQNITTHLENGWILYCCLSCKQRTDDLQFAKSGFSVMAGGGGFLEINARLREITQVSF